MSKDQTIRLGWDAPLEVDWDFQLEMLRDEIGEAAPSRSGALREAFRSADTAVINEAQDLITIEVGRQHRAWPYAAIQNFGGPEKDIVIWPKAAGLSSKGRFWGGGKARGRPPVLRFWWGGRLRFFTHVHMRAGQIHGSNYVEEGVFNWWEKLRRGFRKPVAEWAKKHYGAPVKHEGIPSE